MIGPPRQLDLLFFAAAVLDNPETEITEDEAIDFAWDWWYGTEVPSWTN